MLCHYIFATQLGREQDVLCVLHYESAAEFTFGVNRPLKWRGSRMCLVCYTMRVLLNSPLVSIDLSSGEGAGCGVCRVIVTIQIFVLESGWQYNHKENKQF